MTSTTSLLLLKSCSLLMQLNVMGSPSLSFGAEKYLGCLAELWQAAETGKYADLVPRNSTVNVHQLAVNVQQLVHDILEQWNGSSSGDGQQEQNNTHPKNPEEKGPKSKTKDAVKRKKTESTVKGKKTETTVKRKKTEPTVIKSRKLEGNACEGKCTHRAQDILEDLKKNTEETREGCQDFSLEDEVKKIIDVDTDALMGMIRPQQAPPKIAYGMASLYLYYDCEEWLYEMEGRSERAYSRTWGNENEENVRNSLKIGYKMAVLEEAYPGTGMLSVHSKFKLRLLLQGGLPCLLSGILADTALSSLVQRYSNKTAEKTFWDWAIRQNTARSVVFKEKSKQLLESSISFGFQRIGRLIEGSHQSTEQLTSNSSGRTSQDIAPVEARRIDATTAELHNHQLPVMILPNSQSPRYFPTIDDTTVSGVEVRNLPMIRNPSVQLHDQPSAPLSILRDGPVSNMTPSGTSPAYRSTEGSRILDNHMNMAVADVEFMSNGSSSLPSAGFALNDWEQAGLGETATHQDNENWLDTYFSSMSGNNLDDRGMMFHNAHYPSDWSLGDQIS